MSDKVRVGIVGTSWWADTMFLPALQSHPRAALAAICGRDRRRAAEMAAKYGVPAVFTDYRDMIVRGGLDALIVSVPDDLHHEITMAALAAGLHVLCEKPLAMNSQQAWDMVQGAQTAGVRTMVLFTYRWMPFLRFARALVAEGYVGRLYQAEFRWRSTFGRDNPFNWRFDGRRANGILGDLGSHLIDLARWFVDDIERVSAQLATLIERPRQEVPGFAPANDSANLLVEFANGVPGLIQAITGPPMADGTMRQQINLYGEAGSLEISAVYWGAGEGVEIRGARAGDKRSEVLEVPASYWGDAVWAEPFGFFATQPVGSRAFIDAIAEDRPVAPNFYDGFKVQQVIDAAFESHAAGRAVTIPPHQRRVRVEGSRLQVAG